ncbi:MAG: glycosyltransferase [Bellilinea sp.]
MSAIDYESPIQIGDHQLARQFALDGWEIAFIGKPLTPFHIFSKERSAIFRRVKNYFRNGIMHPVGKGKVWSYVPGALAIPKNTNILRSRHLYRYWHYSMIPDILKMLAKNGFSDVDLIYIRDPLQGYLLNSIRYRHSVFRIADYDSGFASFNRHYAEVESWVARNVDCVVYPSKILKDYVANLHPEKSFYIPNGVDYAHFSRADRVAPEIYHSIPRPIVIYAGSIDDWFDFNLINWLASELPKVSFVIIGPLGRNQSRFTPRPNLYTIGPVEHRDLPGYLWNADTGIIPFDVNRHPDLVNSINPIKLYEYMACGLPVVSTRWSELAAMDTPAFLCERESDFRDRILFAISHKQDFDKYRIFASQNDWSFRYQELISILSSNQLEQNDMNPYRRVEIQGL